MKKRTDLLEQFDLLPEIEASQAWEESLKAKLRQNGRLQHNIQAGRLWLAAVVLLFACNVFTFSKIIAEERSDRQRLSLLAVEKEYLVVTESSNY